MAFYDCYSEKCSTFALAFGFVPNVGATVMKWRLVSYLATVLQTVAFQSIKSGSEKSNDHTRRLAFCFVIIQQNA